MFRIGSQVQLYTQDCATGCLHVAGIHERKSFASTFIKYGVRDRLDAISQSIVSESSITLGFCIQCYISCCCTSYSQAQNFNNQLANHAYSYSHVKYIFTQLATTKLQEQQQVSISSQHLEGTMHLQLMILQYNVNNYILNIVRYFVGCACSYVARYIALFMKCVFSRPCPL